MTKRRGLFGLAPSDSGAHPDYLKLRNSPYHASARELMEALFTRMGDPDGNFVREFQTHGFHSRLFELGCYAYLESTGYSIDRTHARPDFMASRNGIAMAFEATAANPTTGQSMGISAAGMKPWSPKELEKNVSKEFPRRMLSVLSSKLGKRYDRLPPCQGRSLIFFVAPYYEAGSVFQTDIALVPALFEVSNRGESAEPAVPFYSLPDSETVSAVVYCNHFTVSRFYRLASKGRIAQGSGFTHGFAYVPGEGGKNDLVEYHYDLSEHPEEGWSQGVTVYHNPNAAIRLT